MNTNVFREWLRSLLFGWRYISLLICRADFHFNEFYTDQELLFEGATCQLLWKTHGAYKVELLINGKIYDRYLPEEHAVLNLEGKMSIEAIAFGTSKQISKKMIKQAGSLKFYNKERFEISGNYNASPRIYATISSTLKYSEPSQLRPVLAMPDMVLKLPAESELYRQIERAEENIIKPYHNGN